MSPATRLIGNLPQSTCGRTFSMTTRFFPSAGGSGLRSVCDILTQDGKPYALGKYCYLSAPQTTKPTLVDDSAIRCVTGSIKMEYLRSAVLGALFFSERSI